MAKNGFKVLDSDMHVHEPWDLWLNYIDPEFRDRAPVGTSKDPMDMNTAVEGRPVGFVTESNVRSHQEEQAHRIVEKDKAETMSEGVARGFDAVSQLHAMETEGLDAAVLLPTRGLAVAGVEFNDIKFASAVTRAYNDWLRDFCSQGSQRLFGAGMLLLDDVQEAVKEAQRCRKELDFKGIFARPNPVRERNWHDPAYDPLWAECQSLGMPVIFHEGFRCNLPQAMAERFLKEPNKVWTMAHVACHPIEQMYACLCFCMGGVMERYPALRVGFLEGNASWIPFWLWRMDEHYELRERWASDYISMKPSEYFKRQGFVSIDADEEPAKYAVDWAGDENFVFSTDYPHTDSKYPHAVEQFLTLPLSQDSKRKILWDNCARLYDMEVS
ncbi:MAG: amidohydrolase [Chloroflexi bacterium]|nr:amidohydrolase [Chloroflexota bacterium]